MIPVYSSVQEAREHSLDHDLMNRIIGINLYSAGMMRHVSAGDAKYLEGMKKATDELLKGVGERSVDKLLDSLMENAKNYYLSHRNLDDAKNARDILYDCKRIFLNLYSAPLSANFVVDTTTYRGKARDIRVRKGNRNLLRALRMGRLSRISLAQGLSNAADRYANEYIEVAAERSMDICSVTVSNPYNGDMREAARKAGTGRGFRIARTFVVHGLNGSMEIDDKEGLFTVKYHIPRRTMLLN